MTHMFSSVVYLDGEKEEETELTRPGKVRIEFQNGDTFEGTYTKSDTGSSLLRSGYGVYVWHSGGKYEGQYENGKRSGQGTYTFPNGEVYEGEWRNNVKSGAGKYTYSNGDVFTGTWIGDKRSGKGMFYNATEKAEIRGEWKEGKLLIDTVKKTVLAKEEKKVEPEVVKQPIIEKIEPVKEAAPPVKEDPPPTEETPELKKEAPVEDTDIAELDNQEAAAEEASKKDEGKAPVEEEAAAETTDSKAMVIIIAGAPASGKGTQCKHIVEKFGVVHISTGDLLRAAVKAGTEAGKKAEKIMNEGGLVDKEIVLEILKDRLRQEDCQTKGVLLDGYPRTEEQAKDLEELGVSVNLVVLLDVPEDELLERATGRRLDPVSKKIYHITKNPPPEGIEVVHREDDTEERVRHRLKLFSEKIIGLEQFYQDKIKRVDGNREPHEVTQDVVGLLEEVEKDIAQD